MEQAAFFRSMRNRIQYDSLLRRANPSISKLSVAHTINDSNYKLSDGYHIDPTTHYYRAKEEFSGADLKINENSIILDWGCSIGVSTIAIANVHKNTCVIGLDLSELRIRIAIERTVRNALDGFVTVYSKNLSCMVREYINEAEGMHIPKGFIVADGYNAPFNNGTFDALYCMNNLYYVLSNLTSQLASKRIKNITRLVKNNGYLLISGKNEGTVQESIILQNNNGQFLPIYSTFSVNENKSNERLAIIVDNCNK